MPFRRLLLALLLCAGLCIGGAAAASASPHGVLTKAEYHQLQLAQKRIKSLESTEARSFTRAHAVCTRMRPVSRLIAAVRSGCLDLIRLGGDHDRLNARATKCGINPGSQAALLSCMVPVVQSYYLDAAAFYRAESAVNRLAKARGFSSACVAVIGDSPANVAAEGRLAQGLRAATVALAQQNPNALQTLFSQIDAAIRSIRPGPASLSVCPHR